MNDRLHVATHEAGQHAAIARVLTLVCGGASIQPEYDDGCAGHSIIADPLMTAGVWDKRWKFRTGGPSTGRASSRLWLEQKPKPSCLVQQRALTVMIATRST